MRTVEVHPQDRRTRDDLSCSVSAQPADRLEADLKRIRPRGQFYFRGHVLLHDMRCCAT